MLAIGESISRQDSIFVMYCINQLKLKISGLGIVTKTEFQNVCFCVVSHKVITVVLQCVITGLINQWCARLILRDRQKAPDLAPTVQFP